MAVTGKLILLGGLSGVLLALAAPAVATDVSSAATPLGRDANRNGLWDDAEAYLERVYPGPSERKSAVWQLAASMQHFIEYGKAPAYPSQMAEEFREGLECVFYVCRLTAAQEVRAVLQAVLSTEPRQDAWRLAEALVNLGSLEPGANPLVWHRSCRAPVHVLPAWPKE